MNLSFFMGGVMDNVREWFSGYFGAIVSLIPKLLYFLCTLVFQILDILQILVRKIAGLDTIYYETGIAGGSGWQEGDIVFKFIQTIFSGQNSILSNVFWAFIILGVIMLIITTFIAVLRSEYAATDAKSASKGKIIGKSLKAIAAFVVVPVVCFFGVFLANVILQALDSITTQGSTEIATEIEIVDENGETKTISVTQYFVEHGINNLAGPTQESYTAYNFYGDVQVPTTSTPISGLIFQAAASQANRIRNQNLFRDHLTNPNVGIGVFSQFGGDYESAANLLDEAFAKAYKLKDSVQLTSDPFEKDHLFPFGSEGSWLGNFAPEFQVFNKNNVSLVWYYYDLWSFNFIIGIGALVTCAMLLLYLVFGLMKRVFELLMLFLIAPPLTALMPLDDGAALKKWREKFTSKTIGAYGPIVGLNLFFIILPFVTSIKFFGIPAVDMIVNMFFVIVGLIMVKDLCSTISDLIGADNSLKAGSDMAGEVGGTIAKVGKVAASPIGLGVKAIKGGVSVAKALSKRRADKRLSKEMDEQQLDNLKHGTEEEQQQAQKLEQADWRTRRRALRSMRESMSSEEQSALQNKANLAIGKRQASRPITSLTKRARAYKKQDRMETKLGALEYTDKKWRNLLPHQKAKLKQQYRDNLEVIPQRKNAIGKLEQNNETLLNKKQGYDNQIAQIDNDIAKIQSTPVAKGDAKNLFAKYKQIDSLRAHKQNLIAKSDKLQTQIDSNNAKISAHQTAITSAKTSQQNATKMANLVQSGGMLKTQDALKTGKEISQGILKGLSVDSLGPIFSTLGGNLAKGFKDAGGFKEMYQRIQGLSAKEVKIQERFKEQKGLLAAQDSASRALNRGGESGPSKVNLSDESIKRLADAIVNSTKKD